MLEEKVGRKALTLRITYVMKVDALSEAMQGLNFIIQGDLKLCLQGMATQNRQEC